TLTQFGGKLGKERERVAQAHAQIVEEQANRDFIIARYYEQRKCYGAARLYYQSIVKEFPRTRKAEEAKARMEAIRNEPDEPPNRFAWFTGLFGSEKK
ncbi:MAG: outer membrane protein assembly factor BamD, partial [Pirellulales bacterium]|nr:outer membrane protein assembly factor BamD [Pirellulales bacterium]